MAVNTRGIGAGMPTVFNRGEFRWQVALRTDIAGRTSDSQGARVRVVAIAAGHPGLIHATLDERTIDVDLVLYLAVGEIQVFIK